MGAREEGGCKETCTLSAGYDNQHSSPSAESTLRCASFRFPPSRRPLKLTRHLSPLSLPAVAPLIMFVFPSASLRSKHMSGALERGESSQAACSARSLRSPLAPLSLAPLAGASGWRLAAAPSPRCNVPARGSLRSAAVALLPCAARWRSSLPPGSRLVAPPRSVAFAPFPLLRSSPRPGLRRLPLRGCAPCPHRRFRASGRGRSVVLRRCGGVVGLPFLLRGCSRVARLVLPRAALFLRFRLRRAFPAAAASLPTLRFPAAPQLSRAALPRSSAPLRRGALFPPLRSGHPLAARRSFGGRPLAPAAVVCRRSS